MKNILIYFIFIITAGLLFAILTIVAGRLGFLLPVLSSVPLFCDELAVLICAFGTVILSAIIGGVLGFIIARKYVHKKIKST